MSEQTVQQVGLLVVVIAVAVFVVVVIMDKTKGARKRNGTPTAKDWDAAQADVERKRKQYQKARDEFQRVTSGWPKPKPEVQKAAREKMDTAKAALGVAEEHREELAGRMGRRADEKEGALK